MRLCLGFPLTMLFNDTTIDGWCWGSLLQRFSTIPRLTDGACSRTVVINLRIVFMRFVRANRQYNFPEWEDHGLNNLQSVFCSWTHRCGAGSLWKHLFCHSHWIIWRFPVQFSAIQYSLLIDWVVEGTWGTIQRRASSFSFFFLFFLFSAQGHFEQFWLGHRRSLFNVVRPEFSLLSRKRLKWMSSRRLRSTSVLACATEKF